MGFFFPSQIDVVTPFTKAFSDANTMANRNNSTYIKSLGKDAVPFNLYPWTWSHNNDDVSNFNALSQNGKLIVPPILTKLILDREPDIVLSWVHTICNTYDFTHVISSH